MAQYLKRGLMTQFPFARGRKFVCKNIGDYVQAVATRQFVKPIDEFIEQEEANNYYPLDKIPIRLIMNGWFQWRAENWPPSEYVKPLLISMHISPLREKQLLTKKGIEFLKAHSPVGCRDLYTKKLLESKGIPAYFSACMTLTLGEKYYKPLEEKNKICFVDPYFDIPPIFEKNKSLKKSLKSLIQPIIYCAKNFSDILKLSKKSFFKDYLPTGFLDRNHNIFHIIYKAYCFHKYYSKKFNRSVLLNSEYITHWMDVDMSGKVNNKDLLNIAEKLIKKYSSSKLVITSRIHSALPCLGVGTPVVFIANKEVVSENGNFNTPGRLDGLLDFFRILTIDENGFKTEDEILQTIDMFTENTIFRNKDNWKKYAEDLKKKCIEFMK